MLLYANRRERISITWQSSQRWSAKIPSYAPECHGSVSLFCWYQIVCMLLVCVGSRSVQAETRLHYHLSFIEREFLLHWVEILKSTEFDGNSMFVWNDSKNNDICPKNRWIKFHLQKLSENRTISWERQYGQKIQSLNNPCNCFLKQPLVDYELIHICAQILSHRNNGGTGKQWGREKEKRSVCQLLHPSVIHRIPWFANQFDTIRLLKLK